MELTKKQRRQRKNDEKINSFGHCTDPVSQRCSVWLHTAVWYFAGYGYPADDCTGYYKYGDKKYNIRADFETNWLTVVDTGNGDTELFTGDWMYEKDTNGKDQLYIYNIRFNKDDYEELENNYAEFVTLKQEEI